MSSSISIQVYKPNNSTSLGQIYATGESQDQYGRSRGRITSQGVLQDHRGEVLGTIYRNGQFETNTGQKGMVYISQAGAITLGANLIGRIEVGWGMNIPQFCLAYAAVFLITIG